MINRLSPVVVGAILLVSLCCIGLFSADAWRSWTERNGQLTQMTAATRNLAQAMEVHAQNAIDSSDVALVGLVERVEHDGIGTAAMARIQRVIALRMQALPQLDGLFIYGPDGRWLAYSQAARDLPAGVPPNNSDRAYFIYHRDHADRGVHIGFPVRSRSTGHWIVPLSRRIDNADGSFAGVALATLSIDYFRRFYDAFDIGRDGAVALISTEGYLIVRRPFQDAFVGRDFRNSQLFTLYQATGPEATASVRSSQDGIERLNSFRKVGHYPLFVSAAVSKEETLAGWRRNTWVHMATDVIYASMLLLLGGHLIRKINERDRAQGQVLQARDTLAQMNEKLERLAMQDGLTGLANRRHFDLALQQHWQAAMQRQGSVALILIDIDFFKQYNDTYGHLAGDDCLRQVAQAIQQAQRNTTDLVARYGGEELVVLLSDVEIEEVQAIAERTRNAVAALALPHRRSPFDIVTVSSGAAMRRPQRNAGLDDNGALATGDVLIALADQALYRAKASGRNTVEVVGA